jgi:hypothetical protein
LIASVQHSLVFKDWRQGLRRGNFAGRRKRRPSSSGKMDRRVLAQREYAQLSFLLPIQISRAPEPDLPRRAMVKVVGDQALAGVDPGCIA